MPKVSQQLIADKLNICRTTVSRCFSSRSNINSETRAKVLELAAQLGYHHKPQRSTGRLARRKVAKIGVLIGSTSSMQELPLPTERILKGISDRAAALNIALEVTHIDPAELDGLIKTKLTPSYLRPGKAGLSGAILIFSFTDATIDYLCKTLPIVSIAEEYCDAEVDSIDVDHHNGIYKIVSHLASLGHRRIGFLSWRYAIENSWIHRRFGAYVDSLLRLGLEFDPSQTLNILQGQNIPTTQLGQEVATKVREGVTAWVCGADHQAYRLIADLRHHAIKVPEDCSVTGFDGILPPPGFPRAASITVPFEEMGVTCVSRLIDRIINPSAHRRFNLVEGRFIVGQSTHSPQSLQT